MNSQPLPGVHSMPSWLVRPYKYHLIQAALPIPGDGECLVVIMNVAGHDPHGMLQVPAKEDVMHFSQYSAGN